jgi:hypothetical protein
MWLAASYYFSTFFSFVLSQNYEYGTTIKTVMHQSMIKNDFNALRNNVNGWSLVL